MYTMHETNEFWSNPYVFLQVCSVIVWLRTSEQEKKSLVDTVFSMCESVYVCVAVVCRLQCTML